MVPVVLAAALTAACSGSSRPDATLRGTASVTAATAGAATTKAPGALDPKAILAATKRAVAYVTNPTGSGSGVLLPSGYVVTNAHVVQPFAQATLTFPGGPAMDAVPVVGVDAWTDIAVLGPVKIDAPALELGTAGDAGTPEQGDRVYLVGYPDETEKQPTPTITEGIVSRIRAVPEFGTTFLQTDATIAGGQSGGALVDDRGRVVGISGYSLDGFGIALRSQDAAASVARILAGNGSAYRPLPNSAGVTAGTLRLDARFPIRQLYLATSKLERSVTLKLSDAAAPFQAFDLFDGTMYATNGLAEADYLNALPAERQAEERQQLTLVKPGADGTYTFTVAADAYPVVYVGPFKDAGAHDVAFVTSAPVQIVDGLDAVAPLTLGATTEAVVNSFDSEHGYTIALRKGQVIDTKLVAPMGSLAVSIEGPGVDPAGDTPGAFTQTDETPFAGSTLDARFTAPADGTFTIYVFGQDDVLVGYRLTVS